jgi:hypothetical protein
MGGGFGETYQDGTDYVTITVYGGPSLTDISDSDIANGAGGNTGRASANGSRRRGRGARAADNGGYIAFGGIPNAPAIVGSRTQDCYKSFHQGSTAGKLIQLGSLTALTPADPEWKSNWEETLGLGTLKALLVGGAAHSEIGLISAAGHFVENAAAKLAIPVLFTATALDTGARTMCTAGAVSSLGSGW